MRTEFAKLLKLLRKRFPKSDLDMVRAAYRVSNESHAGMFRESGEPYITHPIAVAKILAQLNLDLTTVAAGLLHDVIEDSPITKDQLAQQFGAGIATLVDGVSKIGGLHLPETDAAPDNERKQAVNLRKMLIATAQDVRVILIKLADRLHNMRTLEFLDPERRKRISRETLEIYAPLAHRLGIARWRWELEDHAFHSLDSDAYQSLARRVVMKRREREQWLRETIELLEERLSEAEIVAHVIGRPKHLYSIHQKMAQQGKTFDQVMDILAVRIICQTVSGCYNALGVVHQMWKPMHQRMKDYIALPKANMYQSIHTTVMRENGLPLEVQIRTEEMDRTAREGIAAHWKYKDQEQDASLEEQLKWLRHMYEWLQDTSSADDLPGDLMDSVRRAVSVSDIYVFTPKGEVKELPTGATPLDFAYHIHSDIGHHCMGAKVHGRMVPLRYNLQTGDMVEILTSSSQTPSVDWLDVVVTGKARTRIRQRLRELGELHPRIDPTKKESHAPQPVPPPPRRPLPPRAARREVDDATRQKLVLVDGAGGVAVAFAKCCNPMPGEAIIGYATKGAGITVHRADCRNFAKSPRDPDRIIEVSWEGEEGFEVAMRVTLRQRPNILSDITNAIRPMNITISRAEFGSEENGASHFDFVFEAQDQQSVQRVSATIRTVSGVTNVVTMPAQTAPASASAAG